MEITNTPYKKAVNLPVKKTKLEETPIVETPIEMTSEELENSVELGQFEIKPIETEPMIDEVNVDTLVDFDENYVELDELTEDQTNTSNIFGDLRPSKAEPRQFGNNNSSHGAIQIVNSKTKRIVLSKECNAELGSPKSVKISYNDKQKLVFVGEKLPTENKALEINRGKEGKGTPCIYNSQLVLELTEFFELDFSSKTSHAVGTYKVETFEGSKVLVIKK